MLGVKNLHKSFGSNQVLKGIDFEVNEGEVIAIIGSSGSGKTTLLRCMAFLEQADDGIFTFDDLSKDIRKISKKEIKEIRMKMGFV
ncbi:MAG: amino acid ABC transporter ATP-binding protein, partial [Erysipelotrichaceae bacterium]|nr:amino acid ABC transporter ATP-binding protein [Erysipelotrichaceae bacterium]